MNSTVKECCRLTFCAIAYILASTLLIVAMFFIYDQILIPMGFNF